MDVSLTPALEALRAEATELARAWRGRAIPEDSWLVGHSAEFSKPRPLTRNAARTRNSPATISAAPRPNAFGNVACGAAVGSVADSSAVARGIIVTRLDPGLAVLPP